MNEEEPFLSRWSRLKRGEPASIPEPKVEQNPVAEPAGTGASATPERAPPDEREPFDLAKLPRLEDIGTDTDIRAFLDPRVPTGLQNQALRRAWRLDPVIDTFIEVAENQYDWNTPGGAPGYGPLEAVADLPQLLAQATGRLPDPETLSPEAAADEPVPAAAPAPTSAGTDEPPPKGEAENRALLAQTDPAPAWQLEPRADTGEAVATALPHRRHGSALPR